MTDRDPRFSPGELLEWDAESFAWMLWRNGQLSFTGARSKLANDILAAESLTEAVEIAEDAGVLVSDLNPSDQDQIQTAIRQQSTWGRGHPTARGATDPFFQLAPEEQTQITTLQEQVDAQADLIAQMTEEEPEQFSPLMFFDLPGPEPVDEAYIKLVSRDDYSPWGPETTRAEQANRMTQSFRFREMNDAPMARSEQSYWREQYSRPGVYHSGDELLTYAALPAKERARLEERFVDAGLLEVGENGEPGYVPGMMGMAQLGALRVAMAAGTTIGVGYEIALDTLIREKKATDRAFPPGGGSGSRAQFSVPASLREIPDYESLAQDAQNRFRQRLGRDAEDYELEILASELQAQHRAANAEKIKAARAAFNQAQSGQSGIMEVEVPVPELRLQRFIEDRYGNEITRYENIDDTAATNRLMIDAITRGAAMVGG